MNCPFCGRPKNPFTRKPTYSCGTLVNSPDPTTLACWRGYYNKTTLELSECERQLSSLRQRLGEAEGLLRKLSKDLGWVARNPEVQAFLNPSPSTPEIDKWMKDNALWEGK